MSRRTATARASATGEPLRSAPSTAKSPSNPAPNKSSNRLDGDFFRSLLAVFDELVRIGDGIVPGRKVLKFWGVDAVAAEDLRQVLQTDELPGSRDFARLEAEFRQWYAWTTDLPGAYFLEVVEKLYKRNELARGKFVALGRRIDLATVHTPIFLLGASEDELVAPLQLLATERLVGTSARDIRKAMAAGRHIGLFMGKNVLENIWPAIVRWIGEPLPASVGVQAHQTRRAR